MNAITISAPTLVASTDHGTKRKQPPTEVKPQTPPKCCHIDQTGTSTSSSSTLTEVKARLYQLPVEVCGSLGDDLVKKVQSCFAEFQKTGASSSASEFIATDDDGIHAFRSEGQLTVYVKTSLVGFGTTKIVSNAWCIREPKDTNATAYHAKAVMRSDVNFATASALDVRERYLQATLREAKIFSHVKHPNVCKLYHFKEYTTHSGSKNVVLYLKHYQKTLEKVISQGGLALEFLFEFAKGSLDALAYLHHHKLIHCDIKPSNIVVTDKQFAFIDFGLCNTGRGTLSFMPLSYIGRKQDTHSDTSKDLWALGCILLLMYFAMRGVQMEKSIGPFLIPPWGPLLMFHERLSTSIAELETISLTTTSSTQVLSSEAKTASETTLLEEETEAVLDKFEDLAKVILEKISSAKFNKWDTFKRSDFSDYLEISKTLDYFGECQNCVNKIKKHSLALVILPSITTWLKDIRTILEIRIEEISTILTEIPKPNADTEGGKFELLLWSLLRPPESVQGAAELHNLFFLLRNPFI